MFHHGTHTEFTRTAAFHWFLLSFLSGSVNAGGYLACHRFVTHVTGFATLSGIALANGAWRDVLAMLTVPAFFLGGTMIAAWLTERRSSRGLRPHYATTMALVAVCLAVAAGVGALGGFGPFGEQLFANRDYVLLAVLCLASGLQNAAITSSSGASVRTTHLTGVTTDLGIGLVQALQGKRDDGASRVVARRNRWRLGTIGAFLLGGAAGGMLHLRLGYLGFLLPAAIAVYSVYIARRYPGTRGLRGRVP
jgi:uncharacterized membrane protein YoaK (UPF0700 family)